MLVVEQTETPDQLELRRKEEGSKDKVFFYLTSCIAFVFGSCFNVRGNFCLIVYQTLC